MLYSNITCYLQQSKDVFLNNTAANHICVDKCKLNYCNMRNNYNIINYITVGRVY